jgi:uncharacterized cupredoxin-like copper-binding protein
MSDPSGRNPLVPRSRSAVLVAAALLLLAACGDTDDGATADGEAVDRTVEIDMVDTAFEPDTLEVRRGETVRFVFTNEGKLPHDAFIGDPEAQDDHEADMRADDDGHGHGEDSEDAVTVEPGDTGELTYTFEEDGTLEVGCHQEGHYELGMKVEIEVT